MYLTTTSSGYISSYSDILTLWSNTAGDFLILVSYLIIPFALYYFVRRKNGLRFRGIFVLFSAFILLGGTTHLLNLLSAWSPLTGFLRLIAGVISISTTVALIYIIPTALKIPSPADLEKANKELE